MAARIFLYLIAVAVSLLVVAAIVWNLFQDELLAVAFVPNQPVEQLEAVEEQAYADARMWLARPDIENPPTDWLPEGYGEGTDEAEVAIREPAGEEDGQVPAQPRGAEQGKAPLPRIPVFYVLPTTYLDRDRWNAPLRSPAALRRQRLFAASQASAFNHIGDIWAPLYRQAVLGAFLTDDEDATVALRFAYLDVEAAFDYFLSEIGEDQPFLLVGHSQGSLHITTLLDERIAGTPLAERVVAAYTIGWPISIEADLPALGIPGCSKRDDANCIVAFQSFAEPADPHQVANLYENSMGLRGLPRRGTSMLCVNPLTGTAGGAATAEANLGSLLPNEEANDATIEPGLVPAHCGERGLLLIGAPPDGYERYVLPGNNYHVFDYMLFWANIRADAERRVRAYLEARG